MDDLDAALEDADPRRATAPALSAPDWYAWALRACGEALS
jgi:hypothetical protein